MGESVRVTVVAAGGRCCCTEESAGRDGDDCCCCAGVEAPIRPETVAVRGLTCGGRAGALEVEPMELESTGGVSCRVSRAAPRREVPGETFRFSARLKPSADEVLGLGSSCGSGAVLARISGGAGDEGSLRAGDEGEVVEEAGGVAEALEDGEGTVATDDGEVVVATEGVVVAVAVVALRADDADFSRSSSNISRL